MPVGYCADAAGRDLLVGGHFERLAGGRCRQAVWGFEAGVGLPVTGRVRLTGFDGKRWIRLPSEALLFSPPLHVHVEIGASLDPTSNLGWPMASSRAQPAADTLLDSTRAQPVSLGWVRWYGQRGQLVLAPAYPAGGEWGGHLIFYFTRGRARYAITLHAWMAELRLHGPSVQRTIRLQRGPSLPHVMATLRAIVGSALGGR